MVRAPLLMATLGLAFNLLLWSVPALVGAAGVPQVLFPQTAPSLAQVLERTPHAAGPTLNLLDALTQLIGAEAEAMHVAGQGLQQPPPQDLADQANHASARVLGATKTYIRSAQAVADLARLHHQP